VFLVLCSILVAGEFTFTKGKETNPLCPRSTGLFTENIVNTGEKQEFSVNVEGSAAVWTTSVPSGFYLEQGEEKTIYTYVTPFQDAKPGNYEVSVVVTTPNSVKKITHPVEIKECYDASLSANVPSKKVCPGDKGVNFEAIINNLGEYQENYEISVKGPIKDWVTLSSENVNIEKGGSKSVFAYVDVPEDALGEKEFTLVVKGLSEGSDTQKSLTFRVNVEPCFKFDVVPEKNTYSLCESSSLNIPIEVKNLGTVKNQYNLEIDGPEWAKLSKDSVSLSSGASESVNIQVSPPLKTQGSSNIKLEVIPVKGFLKAINDFNVEVRKCHSVKLDIIKEEDTICNNIHKQYDIIIENDGEYNKEYKLNSTGNWKWLDQETVSVNAGEKKTVKLNVKPSIDANPGENVINVKAVAMDESKVSAEDSIKIKIVDIPTCYEPELTIKPDDAVIYYDSAATIPIQVKNKGERKAEYEIIVSGTASNFVQLSPSTLIVEPADTKVSNLYIAPAAQVKSGDYVAEVAVRLGETNILKSKEVKIEVTRDKDKATIGIPGKELLPGEKPTLWDRIKAWWNGLFEKEEAEEKPVINMSKEVTEEAPGKVEEKPGDVKGVEELKEVRRQMGENDKYLFSLEGEEHSVEVKDIDDNKVSLRFTSDPIDVELNIGESKEVDIDGDGVNDIFVKLNGFTESGKADLTYRPIIAEEEKEPGILDKLWNQILFYKYYILAGIIILVIIIIIEKTNFHKKIIEFFEEEEDEESEEEKEEETREEKEEETREEKEEEKKTKKKKKKK